MQSLKDLNKFIWIGFILDLVGFFMAIFARSDNLYWTGVGIVIAGIVATLIGLWVCIKNKRGVGSAILYLVLDAAFLIYLLAFFR